MKINKKLILAIGASALVPITIAAAIACSNSDSTTDTSISGNKTTLDGVSFALTNTTDSDAASFANLTAIENDSSKLKTAIETVSGKGISVALKSQTPSSDKKSLSLVLTLSKTGDTSADVTTTITGFNDATLKASNLAAVNKALTTKHDNLTVANSALTVFKEDTTGKSADQIKKIEEVYKKNKEFQATLLDKPASHAAVYFAPRNWEEFLATVPGLTAPNFDSSVDWTFTRPKANDNDGTFVVTVSATKGITSKEAFTVTVAGYASELKDQAKRISAITLNENKDNVSLLTDLWEVVETNKTKSTLDDLAAVLENLNNIAGLRNGWENYSFVANTLSSEKTTTDGKTDVVIKFKIKYAEGVNTDQQEVTITLAGFTTAETSQNRVEAAFSDLSGQSFNVLTHVALDEDKPKESTDLTTIEAKAFEKTSILFKSSGDLLKLWTLHKTRGVTATIKSEIPNAAKTELDVTLTLFKTGEDPKEVTFKITGFNRTSVDQAKADAAIATITNKTVASTNKSASTVLASDAAATFSNLSAWQIFNKFLDITGFRVDDTEHKGFKKYVGFGIAAASWSVAKPTADDTKGELKFVVTAKSGDNTSSTTVTVTGYKKAS